MQLPSLPAQYMKKYRVVSPHKIICVVTSHVVSLEHKKQSVAVISVLAVVIFCCYYCL